MQTKKKIGYTSGTFDLFHIGHLNILKSAKASCDYLIVGVRKDASYKMKDPFTSFEERLEIVASVKYVDKAILAFDDHLKAYEELKYDYLFVGSDWKDSEKFKVYESFFADKEVKIIYFPYTNSISSSLLRDKITNSEH